MISYPDDVNLNAIVYLNGNYVSLSDAKISPLDRGFLFADGVYEVIPVYSGSFFCFEMHYQRLQRSLKSIELKINFGKEEFFNIAHQLVLKNSGGIK